MKLQVVELDLKWPDEVSLEDLRSWIFMRLSEFGDPLRWAITSIESTHSPDSLKKLRVEAIVMNLEPLDLG
ncbi:hypothetical protein [Prochlorococcus sp. MIT 1307]|uniref:hypothetical protein n=1 Tax=Prochlorococcus sp. MIT 1307 TaxID=3096219 RepID=UPI002A7532D9|nr:hypothetical protein [Prochlorococcus sp. MIT 1307]